MRSVSTETNNKAITEIKPAIQQLKPSDNQSTVRNYLPVSSQKKKKQGFVPSMSQEKFVNHFKDINIMLIVTAW